MVDEWSVRWGWVERAAAFDRDEDHRHREEQIGAIAEARRTQAMAGTLMLGAAMRRLVGDDESSIEAIDPNSMKTVDVVRLATAGAALLDRGLGIDSTQSDLTGVSPRAVYNLARSMLALMVDELEAGMTAAANANGDLGALVTMHQERLIREAGKLSAGIRS